MEYYLDLINLLFISDQNQTNYSSESYINSKRVPLRHPLLNIKRYVNIFEY